MESILIRGLTPEMVSLLNDEAARNQVSRNTLLVSMISYFTKTVKLTNATEVVLEPIDDVNRHLETLEAVQRESTVAIGHDIRVLAEQINLMIKYMYDDNVGGISE
ncbi:hypothetical protein AB0X56_10230 [Weissella paramesenteroides]|uniref:hypothetical protein n=1 Tax=Bacilli TaxID=91061 RepID=UPI00195104B6|nr:hypothetical protein [Mammaliicoccus sciuri]